MWYVGGYRAYPHESGPTPPFLPKGGGDAASRVAERDWYPLTYHSVLCHHALRPRPVFLLTFPWSTSRNTNWSMSKRARLPPCSGLAITACKTLLPMITVARPVHTSFRATCRWPMMNVIYKPGTSQDQNSVAPPCPEMGPSFRYMPLGLSSRKESARARCLSDASPGAKRQIIHCPYSKFQQCGPMVGSVRQLINNCLWIDHFLQRHYSVNQTTAKM